MKRVFQVLVLLGLSQNAVSQSQEVKTYYGEVHEFQIDYPDDWLLGAGDEIKSASQVIIFSPAEIAGMIIGTINNAYKLSYNWKTHMSILEKHAKKAKDKNFKILKEGEGTLSSGEDYKSVEYTVTSTAKDGTQTQQTQRDYMFLHRRKGAFYNDQFTVHCYTNSDIYEKYGPTFDKIFKSLKTIPKK